MPNFNKSGPGGNGPLTGRGMGFCHTAVPDHANQNAAAGGYGRGLGRRRGFRQAAGPDMRGARSRGFTRRRMFDVDRDNQQDTAEDIRMLKAQAESVKNTLDSISKRMAELERNND